MTGVESILEDYEKLTGQEMQMMMEIQEELLL